ncbi:MAG: hypothetical protein WKG06_14420 [Segetibacter sp.]
MNYTDNAAKNWSTTSSEHVQSGNRTPQYTTRVGAICWDGSTSKAT